MVHLVHYVDQQSWFPGPAILESSSLRKTLGFTFSACRCRLPKALLYPMALQQTHNLLTAPCLVTSEAVGQLLVSGCATEASSHSYYRGCHCTDRMDPVVLLGCQRDSCARVA
jgi:hypothetical protein